nr:hypothetical protein [Tanacetum cinerariifolium]
MGTPTQYLCDYGSGWVRLPKFVCGHALISVLQLIILPRMRTRSAGRPAVESLGGGTDVRVGRGGRGKRLREGNDEHVDDFNGQGNDQGIRNLLPAMLAQVGNQGNVGNQNGNVVNENVQENVRNVLVNENRIEKIESMHDMSGCIIDQKVNYIVSSFVGKALTWWNSQIRTLSQEVDNHAMVGAGHVAYTNRFHESARLIPHLVTPKSMMIKRNGLIKKVEKEEIWGNLARIRVDCKGVPRNVNPVNARNPSVRACYECGSIDHVKSACPRWNKAQGQGGNHPNQVVANNEGQGHGNQGNQARGRAFMLGAEEAREDSNIVTGTFTLNDQFATTLFDSVPIIVLIP